MYTLLDNSGVNIGGAGVAIAPPHFGRINGAAGQRRHTALLLAPPTFKKLLTPLNYVIHYVIINFGVLHNIYRLNSKVLSDLKKI